MTGEPWFDPNHYAWIPGTAYGVLAVLMGVLAAWLAPRGRARHFMLRTWFGLWVAAIGLLVVGAVALADRQPWGIWYGFLLPGVVGTLVVGANSLVLLRRYREAEERRLAARDLL
jgi:uncharacterized membrane protein